MNTLLQNEPAIRLTVFLGVLTTMAMLELAAPRRRLEIPRIVRWSNNLGLVVIDPCAALFSRRSCWNGDHCRAEWLGFVQYGEPTGRACRAGIHIVAGSGDLRSACGFPLCAVSLAAAPGTSHGSGF